MKIYITGIAGFLGSHLAKRLINLGHEVSGNDSMIQGDLQNLPENITLSSNSLKEDIALSTYVLYRGSTVAISAISEGLIPIYVDNGDEQDLDPLYQCSEGKYIVKDSLEFFIAMSEKINNEVLETSLKDLYDNFLQETEQSLYKDKFELEKISTH